MFRRAAETNSPRRVRPVGGQGTKKKKGGPKAALPLEEEQSVWLGGGEGGHSAGEEPAPLRDQEGRGHEGGNKPGARFGDLAEGNDLATSIGRPCGRGERGHAAVALERDGRERNCRGLPNADQCYRYP